MIKLLIILLSLWGFSCFAFNEEVPVDVIAIDYPPYTTASLSDNGIAFSLLNKYAQSNFLVAVSPLFLPPARALRLIKEGNWCVSFYPPDKENDLSRFVPLSENIVQMGFYRLKKKEDFYWGSLKELSGKTVALLRANKVGEMHQSFINSGLVLVYVESIAQGLQMVLKGRVDYAFGDNLALLGNNLIKNQRAQLQFSLSTVYEAQVGFFYNTQCEERLFGLKNK